MDIPLVVQKSHSQPLEMVVKPLYREFNYLSLNWWSLDFFHQSLAIGFDCCCFFTCGYLEFSPWMGQLRFQITVLFSPRNLVKMFTHFHPYFSDGVGSTTKQISYTYQVLRGLRLRSSLAWWRVGWSQVTTVMPPTVSRCGLPGYMLPNVSPWHRRIRDLIAGLPKGNFGLRFLFEWFSVWLNKKSEK